MWKRKSTKKAFRKGNQRVVLMVTVKLTMGVFYFWATQNTGVVEGIRKYLATWTKNFLSDSIK